jgi:hypothetical protein
MWYHLGLFGSRVVEAITDSGFSVAEADSAEKEPEEDRAYGEPEKVTVVEADSAEKEPEEDRAYGEHEKVIRMEGRDASALIATRMGIDQGEVGSKLVALHRKRELDGTADQPIQPMPDQPMPDEDEDNGDISLTIKDLEEFEKAEAEAKGNKIQAPPTTPHKLTLKPAVLGAPRSTPSASAPSAAPTTPSTSAPSAAPTTPSTSAPSAERQEGSGEVASVPTPDADSQSPPSTASASNWCDGMEVEVITEEEKEKDVETDVWPEQWRYGEAVEAENIYGAIAAIEVPLLDNEILAVGELHLAVQEVVGQVNVAHKALATAGYVVAERSREALQQAKISSNLATEALLKAYEVAAVAASSSRQSWKMCIQIRGPDMPARSKDAERKPETTGRYLATKLFGVTLRPEEVAISHFRGPHSNEFIMKFTRTGHGSSHEDMLHASKAMGQNRKLALYAKIPQADVDSELYFLLPCMVKAGEAENCYTARSGRPAAWLKQDGDSAPYSFSTVMEVRALMGPDDRKEEARRKEEGQVGRRKRALTRKAVGSGLKEAIREMGLMEDIVRNEACEKGIVKGGGIRKKDKADVAIFRGIKLDAVPAWAEYGRGRGGRGA